MPKIDTASLLKSWRARMGFSQSHAAEFLRVNLRTYQGREAGKRFPYPEILKRALA